MERSLGRSSILFLATLQNRLASIFQLVDNSEGWIDYLELLFLYIYLRIASFFILIEKQIDRYWRDRPSSSWPRSIIWNYCFYIFIYVFFLFLFYLKRSSILLLATLQNRLASIIQKDGSIIILLLFIFIYALFLFLFYLRNGEIAIGEIVHLFGHASKLISFDLYNSRSLDNSERWIDYLELLFLHFYLCVFSFFILLEKWRDPSADHPSSSWLRFKIDQPRSFNQSIIRKDGSITWNYCFYIFIYALLLFLF